MMQIAPLTLSTPDGDFEFTGAEIPETINFGGEQLIAVHQLIGGGRIIDTMGASDAPITWKGWFLSATAEARAGFLDSVRRNGDSCTLTWSDYSYTGVVSDFKADYQKPFRIPYTITFTVETDNTALASTVPDVTATDALNSDSQDISGDISDLGNADISAGADPSLSDTLSTAFANVQTAIGTLQSVAQPIAQGLVAVGVNTSALQTAEGYASAVASAAQAVAEPLSDFQDQVSSAIDDDESATDAISTLGAAVQTAGSITARIAQISAGVNAQAALPVLYQMSDLASRMQANAALVTSPATATQVVVGGGTLYGLASQVYGDAAQWQQIAQANGISDPTSSDPTTLAIPA